MSVRYRPRGFDAKPGRRVAYVFENEITRKKGIPPKTSYGMIMGVHNGFAWVRFDGNDWDSTVPIPLLADESEPGAAEGVADWSEWYRRHPASRVDPWEAEWQEWRENDAYDERTNVRKALMRRAEERSGLFDYWKRPTRSWYVRNRIPMPKGM